MKVVRDSKFRHVFAEQDKARFEDLRPSSKATESTGIRGNGEYFALPWEAGGGGSLAVLPLSKPGRMPRDLPVISGHTGGIVDFEFYPFNDSLILTASEDSTMKLWQIPEGGLKSHMKDPVLTLEGHGKKLSFATFNPCADGIVASTSFDMTLRTWSAMEGSEVFKMEIPEIVMHLKWNYVGSLIAMTCKDKHLRIVDPRSGTFAAQVKIHEGVKPSKVEWLGSPSDTEETYKFVTTGFTAQAQRQLAIWDMRKLNGQQEDPAPLNMLDLDQGTGCLYPFFDPATQMLYISGKGDANVRYFEGDPADPFLHFVSDFRTTVPQKGFDFLPKRCVDTSKHEIARGLKLENNAVCLVSWRVPRKSDAFQDDLYPDAPSGSASMTADEWVGGSECRPPALADMKSLAAGAVEKPKSAVKVVTVKELKAELAEAKAQIEALKKENALLKQELSSLKP
eukprot:SRR837773.1874.p1 GENE.SRR837773.1874~~SRR837773.1874.p1  ORF type:complete len:463 (-),score=209.65 SRR837773.1874:161-1516(-)